MDEEKELAEVIKEVLNRFGMTRSEAKEEGLPEGLFEILKTQTYLPVNSIKQQWLSEEKLFKELNQVKNTSEDSEDSSDFYGDQDFYLPSDELLDQIFDEE